MAALDMQKMSQALKATVGWLMMTGDYYVRLNRGEFRCVLVEGETDRRLLNRGAAEDTKIHAINEVFRTQDLMRREYMAWRSGKTGGEARPAERKSVHAKSAVIDVMYALKLADFLNGPKGAADWQLYGVIDSDYDSEKTISIPPNLTERLFRTDTHDIETLLLWTDPDLPLRLLDGFFCEEDVKRAFALACQMAKLRMALYSNAETMSVSLPDGRQMPLRLLIRERLHSMPDEDIDLFVREWEIDVSLMISYACGYGPGASARNALPEKGLQALTRAVLKDKIITRSMEKDKKRWKMRGDSFKPDADFWSMTQGHDIARFLRYAAKDKMDLLNGEQLIKLMRNTEFMLVEQYHLSCFSKSELGGKLIKAGVWDAKETV